MTNKNDELKNEQVLESGDVDLEDVSGGRETREEYTIEPNDQTTWESFNPSSYTGKVDFNNINFNGTIQNRDDDAGFIKNK